MAAYIDLLNDNLQISLTSAYVSPTSLSLSWTLPLSHEVPNPPNAYRGGILLLSTSPITPANSPVNGTRYTASSIFTTPADTIGGANVVGAVYSMFGGDITTNSITITGLTPNTVYYGAIFIVDDVLQYGPPNLSYQIDQSVPQPSQSSQVGMIDQHIGPPANPRMGQVYYDPTANKVFMWNATTWQEVLTSTVTTGTTFPTGTRYTQDPIGSVQNYSSSNGYTGNTITPLPGPVLAGTFFFNIITNILYVYDGTNWEPCNTNQPDVPLYEKVPIGTTGSNLERIEFVSNLKSQLGWPAVCVELSEDQFNLATDLALRELRRRSDSAYHRKHMLFPIHPNQPVYYLNDPKDDSDKIVDIIKIHRITQFGINAIGGDNGVYSQTFFNQVFQSGQMIDLLSIYLIAQLGEEYTRMFAGDLQYEWRENTRELRILRKLYKEEIVVLECSMEKTEQELFKDRWVRNWLYDWAIAVCCEHLAMIRGKYQSLPGPGGISMNGAELAQKADTMKIELQRQVIDFELGNNADWGCAWMLMG